MRQLYRCRWILSAGAKNGAFDTRCLEEMLIPKVLMQ